MIMCTFITIIQLFCISYPGITASLTIYVHSIYYIGILLCHGIHCTVQFSDGGKEEHIAGRKTTICILLGKYVL